MSEQYIKYEAQLHIMKCRLYKEDITKNEIAYHYKRYHKEKMSLSARKDLIKYCNNFAVYMKEEFQYLKTIISPIEDRMIERDIRYLFNDCNYTCLLLSSME